jgi:hypothetical protein
MDFFGAVSFHEGSASLAHAGGEPFTDSASSTRTRCLTQLPSRFVAACFIFFLPVVYRL